MVENVEMINTPKEETIDTPKDDTKKDREDMRQHMGRIIVRNLAFDLREKHVKAAFLGLGRHCKIESINIPLNQKNNQNRGFAFVEFETR